MRFLKFTASIALTSVVAAVPDLSKVRRDASSNSTCVSQSDAESIVAEFITVMEHKDINTANETVLELLSDSFTEASDSINTIAGNALGSITFPNKGAYIASVLNAPAPRNITTLKLMPAGCTNILWYWKMQVGTDLVPVQGFNLMEVGGNNKLLGQLIEFNSIAWAVNTGFTVKNRAGQNVPVAGQVSAPASGLASSASSVSATSVLPLLLTAVVGYWGARL
ncbi:hypothetical protein A1O7_01923 [Cladophialophora yegresii CBS 114405]|uniref:NTF2-like domain-containing protein n=1 Tax=Cladophialophora yegresii CBS 114405 TaxID=1182544 RepID=W9WBT8_9EURO|nr:uncharacterized protein A1O7_01923 [Cladophialophora yegresii CBS 114405]EXJ65582.1 hypothetical protein A1O7_01923 [Cladophialophora yegresii CBS 114405]